MPQNYSDKIKDHYRNPRNTGKLSDYTHTAEKINPLCGDEVKIYLEISDSKINNLSYEARGCMICVASASVVSEYAKDKSISDIKKLGADDVAELLGVNVSPARKGCILLVIDAVRSLHTSL